MTTRVQLSSLQIGKRHRAIDKRKVASLTKSMGAIGLQQPISVFQDGDAVHLVAGLHRVEAAKRLGWEHVDGIVVELDELDRELWEIDENLMRAELSLRDATDGSPRTTATSPPGARRR